MNASSISPSYVSLRRNSTLPPLPRPHSSSDSELLIDEFAADQDTSLNDVLSIREEIVTNAINICYDNYLERQTIKYLVQNSYDAWMQLLNLECYPHDYRMDFYEVSSKNPQEKSPIPSIPDTWVANTIRGKEPSKAKEWQQDNISNDEDIRTQILLDAISAGGDANSLTVSDGVEIQPQNLTPQTSFQGNAILYQPPFPSEDNTSDNNEEEPLEIKTAPSFFTTVATAASKRDGTPTIYSRNRRQSIVGKAFKLKSPLPCNAMQHPRNIQLEDLPPVRAPITFKYNVQADEEDKKKSRKK